MRPAPFALVPLFSLAVLAASCSSSETTPDVPGTKLTAEQLMDPQSCVSCHPNHVREWSGSMHAYASDDPVFLAMNRRMQRETKGANAGLCVQCHAPVALRTGATTDGLNLDTLPRKLKGVTCIFCHTASPGNHSENNPLVSNTDGVLLGGIANPVPNAAHPAAYSMFLDREASQGQASIICGTCHDIVTPGGAHIERTFHEWGQSVYARGDLRKQDNQILSCGQCHLPSRIDVAARAPNVFLRRVHDHGMAAVDLALTPFPEMDAQRAEVQRQLDLGVVAKLCVAPPDGASMQVRVTLSNNFVGHGFPSGSSQDRRVWVELVAYANDAAVFRSGTFTASEPITEERDPSLFLLRDRLQAEGGRETRMFWEATAFTSKQLSAKTTAEPTDPDFDHSMSADYTVPREADRVTMAVHVRPIDVDLLDELAASGDLTDDSIRSRIQTFSVTGANLAWTSANGYGCVP